MKGSNPGVFYDYFRTDVDSRARGSHIGIRTMVLSGDGADLAAAEASGVDVSLIQLDKDDSGETLVDGRSLPFRPGLDLAETVGRAPWRVPLLTPLNGSCWCALSLRSSCTIGYR